MMKSGREKRGGSALWLALATLVLALSLGVAACGGSGDGGSEDVSATPATESLTEAADTATGADGESLVIGNSVPQGSDPVLAAQAQALEAEAERLGHTVLTADANLDPGKQIADVDSFIQQGIDVLVIWPLDSQGIQPALDRAREKDIPIIVRETTAGGPYYTNFEAPDEEAGRAAAQYLAEKHGEGAKVAAILGPEFIEVFRQRNAGFLAGAEEFGLEVVDRQTNDRILPEISGTFAQQWKQRFGPELKAIFDPVDATALAAAAAKDESFSPDVVGIGGGEEAIAGVQDGRLSATWDMLPIIVGRAEAWAADKAGKGETLPTTIDIPLVRVDSSNVEEWRPFSEQIDAPLTLGIEERDGKAFLTYELG